MQILVTGGAGLLGGAVVDAFAQAGHLVTALDRTPGLGARISGRRALANVTWLRGDLRDPLLLERATRGKDAVFHAAAILAPRSERCPDEAREVNVEGTRRLLRALVDETHRRGSGGMGWPEARPGIIYPSSVALYGPGDPEGPPRGAEDPIWPTDHYTRHKAEAEALVRASGLPWLILRVGVVLHPFQAMPPPEVFRWMFEVRPENRLEIVHPRDAARAVVHSLREPRAWQRVLPLGGGRACQVRQKELLDAALGAVGISALPADLQGARPFYTDWLDTCETERLLGFQRYTFADFRRESGRRHRWVRAALRPLAPVLGRALAAWVRAGRARAGRVPIPLGLARAPAASLASDRVGAGPGAASTRDPQNEDSA